MLAVHWTPVSKTKTVLKNGIAKSKSGLYCFPLTGHKAVDRWWIYFFNQCRIRDRKKYNGVVFRIKQQDLPAYFGPWPGATTKDDFDKEITNIKQLGTLFRETITWRLGEQIAFATGANKHIINDRHELYSKLANEAIQKSPTEINKWMNDLSCMLYTMEDYQIVLSNSIAPDRILKILPQGDEYGKIIRQKKMHKVRGATLKF